MKKSTILASLLLSSTLSFGFDLKSLAGDVIKNVTEQDGSSSTNKTNSNLSDSTVSNGLKEALKQGVSFAVTALAKDNGYLDNAKTRIGLPNNLDKAESIIKKAGGEKYVNELIQSMNDAATKAAPKTAEVFVSAIDKMSIDDAQKILTGKDTAATDYFKANTMESLKKVIAPIVQESIKSSSVATYYDSFNGFYQNNAKGLVQNESVMGLAKNFGVDKYIPGNDSKNLDEYITESAINGLFTMIAEKESAIRKDPVQQTTSILKQVFGN